MLLMMKAENETLRTSWTLVRRLKVLEDQESWDRFEGLYRRLVMGVAVKAGLRQEEAEDVWQETMASVSKHIQEFETNRARGSFRAWLLKMARWRICDQFRKRLPVAPPSDAPSEATATTPTVERVPDTHAVDLEALCDKEFKEQLLEQGLKVLPHEVKADHYQVFHLAVIEGKPVAEVARMVGCSRAQVYVVKHRVGRALKRIVKRLERELR